MQHSLKNLEQAYKNLFGKRAGFPRKRRRGRNDTFRYPQGFRLEQHNDRILLPKLGWVKYRNSRQVQGLVKNVTVSLKAGKWYIAIQTEIEVEQPRHAANSMVGIDVGVAKLATLSDGTVFEPVSSFAKKRARLARAQRAMSRKIKRSHNGRKSVRRVQRIHTKVANIRRDYLHKVSNAISKNHAMIVIEDLQVSNMSKSAKGSADSPGRNVRAKTGLNRSILDQGGMNCGANWSTSSSGVAEI